MRPQLKRDSLGRNLSGVPLNHRQFLACALAIGHAATLFAQDPTERKTFHDRATQLIAQMASRPLTPGDTFLTWNPDPGGLIHTVHVDSTIVESSLLRGDRMTGTAHIEWTAGRVAQFTIRWTRSDTLRAGVDSAIAIRGWRDRDSIRFAEPSHRAFVIPQSGWWAVADFGMEEQLIPLFRQMPAGQPAQPVAILRPYHLRWDTVTVAVRDSAGLRVAEVLGRDKAHELFFIDRQGRLLCVWRIDTVGERLPLPTSARDVELEQYRGAVRALIAPFPVEHKKNR